LTLRGRLYGSSNGTLLCEATIDPSTVRDGGADARECVYKPVAGERPLWDFPDHTLGHREVAAYLMAQLFHELDPDVPRLVPVTVWRDEGPMGPGACQSWIPDADVALVDIVPPDQVPDGWRTVLVGEDDDGQRHVLAHADDPCLRRMALFDLVVNNSDRKGGHILSTPTGALYGVDHGLCFSVDDKVRTVLWGWAGDELDDRERTVLDGVLTTLRDRGLEEHLTSDEIEVTLERAHRLLRRGRFPRPSGGWPAIPWPAF
jgi:uncharacterized repeat protein (TIGR03843 family)